MFLAAYHSEINGFRDHMLEFDVVFESIFKRSLATEELNCFF